MMTGFLAEENLTGRAQKNVRKILDVIKKSVSANAGKTDCPDAPDARLVSSALPDTGHGKDACFWNTKQDGAQRTAFQSREKGGRYARPRLYSGGCPAGSVCGGGAGEDPLFVQQPAAWKSFSRFFIRMKISVCPVSGIRLAG